MKGIILVLRSVVLAAGCLCCLLAADVTGNDFQARVVRIIDGDSMVVRYSNGFREIRLYGIDCPEYDQPYSRKAKQFMKKHLQRQQVNITIIDRDKYGRDIAMVEKDGINYNGLLVQKGLAWVYPRYCHKKICRDWARYEVSARRQEINLWKSKKAVSPWVWKHRK